MHVEFRGKKTAVADKDGDASTSGEVKEANVLGSLLEMGYSELDGLRAIESCGDAATIEELVAWLVNHQDDIDIDTSPVVPFETRNLNLVSEAMKNRSSNLRSEAMKNRSSNLSGDGGMTSVSVPELYTRRLIKYEKNMTESMIAKLKESHIIAEDLEDEKVLEEIKKALSGCNPRKKKFSFELPSLTDSAYVFDRILGQICLAKGDTYNCTTEKKKYAAKARRIGSLLFLIRKLVEAKEVIRLRSIYYADPVIYTNQVASDDAVGAVSMMFKCSRSSLHIRPAPRGTIIGPVLLCADDTIVVNCTLGGLSGNKIPSEMECINKIHQLSKVDFVLVVEKETVFNSLSDMDFYKKHNCVIITASGEPDVATRLLLRKLRTSLDVPVCALVDPNPFGFEILCTYRFGSVNRAYDNLALTVRDLHWIGVFPSDIDPADRVKLEGGEIKKLHKLLAKQHVNAVVEWRGELMDMDHCRYKADIEVVVKRHKLEEYIMGRVKQIIDLSIGTSSQKQHPPVNLHKK